MPDLTSEKLNQLPPSTGITTQIVQVLTITLGNEEYGIDILRVQEIRGWEPVSRIPNVPPHEKGVINLRGAIVPIVDLRLRFNLEQADLTPLTSVVVVQSPIEERLRVGGIVVDSVSDVLDVENTSIQTVPNFGAKLSTEFIHGLVTAEGRMISLLNVDELLNLET